MRRISLIIVVALFGGLLWSAPARAADRCAREATIKGTSGPDRLVGTPRKDVIAGLGGNDVIEGRGGPDVLCGGNGRDVLRGGPGSDNFSGDAGSDRESGDAGDDSFSPPADEGDDRLNGGHGHDTLFFNRADGSVVVDLARGFARFDGQRDTLTRKSFEVVYGSSGPPDRILGDDESNILFAGFESSGDVIKGRGGDDYLEGYEGDQQLFGGDGDDVFTGHFGRDLIDGGPGTDLIRICGVFSQDVACGGSPVPDQGVTIDLGAGTMGDTTLVDIENAEGTQSADEITGSEVANALYGASRADQIDGGGGDDLIVGDARAPVPSDLERYIENSIAGPDGDDRLNGGDGSDSLDGNGGNDECAEAESTSNCEN